VLHTMYVRINTLCM